MAKQYKHCWIDSEKKPFMMEGFIDDDLESAIKTYPHEAGLFTYCYTLVWDTKEHTCNIIDIEDIIKERKIEEEGSDREEHKNMQSDIAYFSWAQAGGGNY